MGSKFAKIAIATVALPRFPW